MVKNVQTLRKRGKIWRMKAHMEGGGFSKEENDYWRQIL